MNPLQANQKKKEQTTKLLLPKEIDLAINLIYAFIRNVGTNHTTSLGLKLAIILSGARNNIEYDEDNRVKFDVDELCSICNIERRALSAQIKTVIGITYTFVDVNGDVVGTTPIHTYRYTRDNKYLYISVSREAKKLFTELGKGGYQFTQSSFQNLMNLQHKHTLRMQLFLDLLNNYSNNAPKRIRMSLEEINGYFGTNYSRFAEIDRKILKPVKEEITNSNNSLTFEYQFKDEAIGTGRPKITEVVIDLLDNAKLKQTNEEIKYQQYIEQKKEIYREHEQQGTLGIV